jgi:hypothetical protein
MASARLIYAAYSLLTDAFGLEGSGLISSSRP